MAGPRRGALGTGVPHLCSIYFIIVELLAKFLPNNRLITPPPTNSLGNTGYDTDLWVFLERKKSANPIMLSIIREKIMEYCSCKRSHILAPLLPSAM